MKLSAILYAKAEDLWKEAADKPFVTEMAKGTLEPSLFRNYMLQDYLYLLEYIDILESASKHTKDSGLRSFLCNIIEETRNETERVHVPNMRAIGITDAEMADCRKADIIIEYTDFMRQQLMDRGLIAGLTALLQCSWIYAYIGQKVSEKYSDAIAASPYRSWFAAYTCRDYVDSNQRWIDVLDDEAEGLDAEETACLCSIFETCAQYENKLWDVLYEG